MRSCDHFLFLSQFSLSSNNYALHMHEGQQNQRADRGYSHCHEGARGHHVCARHACAPRPRTKGLCVRWCGAHGTVAHAQRGLGLCMRGLVWRPSWSATNTPVNFPSGVVDQHHAHGLLVCGCCPGWPKLISVLIKTVCFGGPKPQSVRF